MSNLRTMTTKTTTPRGPAKRAKTREKGSRRAGARAYVVLGVGAGLAAAVWWLRRGYRQESGAKTPSLDPNAQRLTSNAPLAVTITPEMVAYSNARYALYFASAAWSGLALLFVLRSGLSARFRDLAFRKGRNGLGRAFIYYPLFALAYGALSLPLAFYGSFVLPHRFGLSNQSLRSWLEDGLKGYLLGAGLGSPVIALLYWALERSPRRWWLGFWLASIPLLVFTILLSPLVIDPLFNRFTPLKNERLRERILELAERAGIQHGRVFEVDASRRTKAVNAYVTGLGGSARIVLWDTLLERLDEDEILFVMAHEMGHYAEKHVPALLAASIAGTLVFLIAGDWGTRRLLDRWGDQWQVTGLDDLASLPALTLLTSALGFLASPAEAAFSRYFERRADDFGLRTTGNGRAAASGFIRLSELNLSHPEPPPFIEFWMFTHPPLNQRIENALSWES